MLLESMDKEKQYLMKNITELESELKKLKDSKDKIKNDNMKKSSQMKDKLEKALIQLTANDEAANELSRLRTQIKEMQD